MATPEARVVEFARGHRYWWATFQGHGPMSRAGWGLTQREALRDLLGQVGLLAKCSECGNTVTDYRDYASAVCAECFTVAMRGRP